MQIGESLTRFGVQENCTSLLIARFDATDNDLAKIRTVIKGTETPLSDLPNLADMTLLRKYYKLSDEELGIGSVGSAIVSRIAARDCS